MSIKMLERKSIEMFIIPISGNEKNKDKDNKTPNKKCQEGFIQKKLTPPLIIIAIPKKIKKRLEKPKRSIIPTKTSNPPIR